MSNEIIQFLRGQIPGYHRGWGGPEYTGWQDEQMFWKQTCYVLSKGAYDAQWRCEFSVDRSPSRAGRCGSGAFPLHESKRTPDAQAMSAVSPP